MKIKPYFTIKFILLFAVLSLAVPLTIAAQSKPITGNSADTAKLDGTIVTFNGKTLTFSMEIKEMTSAQDIENNLNILKSKGQDGFQKAIEKQDLGYFAITGQVGQDLNYVTQTKTDEGTKIIAVFSRWLKPFETRYGSISSDYPFTYIEIFIDNNGKGSGTIIGAARVQIDKNDPNSLDFENFGAYPAKLIGVKLHRKDL